ncbi:MAG: FAD-dependent oxidoreductase, partial [Clostridiales Family XIII bacterium]|nr:FAD-dependent oxidoreductase [Clostridiales Family XIII bacterium]
YGVHAAKVARTGVDFFLKHTIQKVWGDGKVEHVTIVEVDKTFAAIPGTEKTFDVDTICMAVGLSPMSQLLGMAGCEMTDERTKGGIVPKVDAKLQTTIPGIYAAGDVSGIEEASAAMIEGRIAGAGAALSLGYINETDYEKFVSGNEEALNSLRRGLFSPKSKGDISITKTEEGIDLSLSLFEKGYMTESELTKFAAKGFANETGLRKLEDGIFPVIECTQNIPCNPCQDACPKGCIKVGADIVALPAINEAVPCVGCGMCVSSCSGQAIFLVERGVTRGIEHGFSYITMPYEFRPLPKEGDEGIALDRSGKPVCSTIVVKVKDVKAMDKTALLTIKVPTKYESAVRFWEEDSASKLKSA